MFRRERPTLFGELLDWMLVPLLLLWPITLGLTWLVAQSVAGKPFDRSLEFAARSVIQWVSLTPPNASNPSNAQPRWLTQVQAPAQARELLSADESDVLYWQVLGAQGEYVSGERELPLPPEDTTPTLDTPQWRDIDWNDQSLRVVWLWVQPSSLMRTTATLAAGAQALQRGIAAKPVLVQVAETREKRATLATEIVRGAMLPLFIMMPLAVVLVWLALERGIRPVRELEGQIRKRSPDDLSPIDDHVAPEELLPLLDSINEHLERLKAQFSGQRRFLADAAHQLKTPLAGLRMQAELALREGASEEELKASLRHVLSGSTRATHAVNQLLALARAESSGMSVGKEPVVLPQVLAEVVRELLPHAMERGIDLGYDGPELDDPDAPGPKLASVSGNPTLLHEMVRNLTENALQYTPEGGTVTVRSLLEPFSGAQLVHVEDNGPGIPLSERELVMQPFYRVLGTGVDGSGLGLAIVQKIAQQHGASISISETNPGGHPPGTRFTVKFEPA